jgi:hypothetical protein
LAPHPPPAGLLKLVFATETLAAGINMPARTTLVAALSRRRDGAIGPLQHNELLQMAGRAGRRGYDTVGNCVVLQVGLLTRLLPVPGESSGFCLQVVLLCQCWPHGRASCRCSGAYDGWLLSRAWQGVRAS